MSTKWVKSLHLGMIQNIPGNIGYMLRYRYYKKRLKHLGKDVRIDINVLIDHPESVTINDRCAIDKGTIILAGTDSTNREKTVFKNEAYVGEPGEVIIGRYVHISPYCIVSGKSGGVSIGDYCGLSAKVTIHSFSNHYRSNKNKDDTSICFTPLTEHKQQSMISGPVVLGENVGIALNAVILPGTFIAKNSFISINSVVMPGSRFAENSLIGGNPAKNTGKRFIG
jgi:acetyltransferase-like isoleucine patch superfamily enzyme